MIRSIRNKNGYRCQFCNKLESSLIVFFSWESLAEKEVISLFFCGKSCVEAYIRESECYFLKYIKDIYVGKYDEKESEKFLSLIGDTFK